jgi:hypothetical protein
MLAELAIANAAFKIIKTTLSNGKEIADAGSALTKYFGASQSIQQKAKMGTGDVLAAYQAKQAIERQEKELEWMLNKQGLLGYYKYQQFKEEFKRKHKAEVRKKLAEQKALEDNITLAIKVMGILLVIMAALFGVALYLRN